MEKRWFAEITRKRIRRSVFYSAQDLKTAMEQHTESNNQNPRPFVRTEKVERVLKKSAMVELHQLHNAGTSC